MSVSWQNDFKTTRKNWLLNSPPNVAIMLIVSVLISPINSAFFFPWSHLEIWVSFFKFNFLDITLPALESIWIYCSSLMNLIVPSAFLLFCTRPYNTLNSPANMNVLSHTFSWFAQIHLCLLQCHPLGKRLNFTQGPKHVCLTFTKLQSFLEAEKLGDPRLM